MAEGACMKVGEKEFCYSRAAPCPCAKHQNYASHNAAKVESWGTYLQRQERKDKDTKQVREVRAQARSAEHHHILCVAAIQKFLGVTPQAMDHARATTWCINDSPNMIALPMWSMHLMHYMRLAAERPSVRTEPTSMPSGRAWSFAGAQPPPFANLPMHDQDHDVYIDEVDADLAKLAADLPLVEDCQDPEAALKAELDRLIEKYSTQLNENGAAAGGTHKNWEKGINDPYSDWYRPFSMCRTPTPRIHPMSNMTDFQENVDKLHQAFWLEGHPYQP